MASVMKEIKKNESSLRILKKWQSSPENQG
jgi:hypothetical protein